MCADCDVPLVAEQIEEPTPELALEAIEMVTVLTTGSEALITIAASLLGSAGIAYVVKRGEFEASIGWEGHPAHIQVDRGRAEEARQILEGLEEHYTGDRGSLDDPDSA